MTDILLELPSSLRDIAEVIGVPGVMALVSAFGGTSPRVPSHKNIQADHPLAVAIGIDEAIALAKQYGGTDIYVPRCARGLRDARDREIIARYEQGGRVDALAREYGLSDRQIWNILKKPMDDGQGALF